MRRILVLCSALVLIVACSRQESAPQSGFRPGTAQEVVLKQISQMKGKILKQTTNEVLAEVSPPDIEGPVQVHLTFEGGVLDRVYFLPKRQ